MTSGDWRYPDPSGHEPHSSAGTPSAQPGSSAASAPSYGLPGTGGPGTHANHHPGQEPAPSWSPVTAGYVNGSPPPYMVIPSSSAPATPLRRRPMIIAGAVGALLLLGTGTAFASTAYASDKVCTTIGKLSEKASSTSKNEGGASDGAQDALAETQSELRTASRMLVMKPDLRDAVDGLVADIDLLRTDDPGFAEMMTAIASVNTHVREAQKACDLPVTGVFGDKAPAAAGTVPVADTEAPAADTEPSAPPTEPAEPTDSEEPEPSETSSPQVTPDAAGTEILMTSHNGENKYALSVTKLRRNQKPSEYQTAKKGMFVSVVVAVTGKKGVTELDTDAFKLVADDGTVYESQRVYSADDEFDADGLNPGEKTSGKVYFDVPRDLSKHVKVVLKVSSFSGEAAAIWQF
ncbi:DUF4352 domain-containing protein [Actinoplanes sp. NPDC049548]|uniref:DUF4352 domain-containing protein n=1 Tax=Actinoplanes sp. NPDC049548 TaxID=3155152 RepID=UPI003434C4E7